MTRYLENFSIECPNLIRTDQLEILEATYRHVPELMQQLQQSRLGKCVLRGNALRGNAIRTSGRLILIDLDSMCEGPREWDLAPTAVACRRFGRGGDAAWHSFLSGYGVDEAALSDLGASTCVKELAMAIVLCPSSGRSKAFDNEIARPIDTWARWDLDAGWRSPSGA